MNKLNEEIQEKLTNKVFNSFFTLILLFTSISFCLILVSFSPDDPSWGFASNKIPTNFYNTYGAWIAGFVIREFGIFPGLLTSVVLFIWSLKLFNRSDFKFLKIKLFAFLLMIIFSACGGVYVEGVLNNNLQLEHPIINQNGLAEWGFLKLTNEISLHFKTDLFYTNVTFGICSLIISLIMSFWVSSLGYKETKFLKFIMRPFYLPIIWVLSILYNLFFISQKNYENEKTQNFNNFNLFNFIKTLYLKFTHENNFIERKLPKLRKKPISVKNQKDNDISKKTTNKNISVQQNLQLSSENGFVLPPVTLLKNVTEDIKPPSKETLDANAKVLEGVLSDYSINGNIDTVRYGPVVTRYDLQPAPGLRSQRVVSLADDIARSMTVEAVRVAMVSGQNVIGIELPNKIRETVLLRNILEHEEFQNSRFNLPVCLGKNIAGYPVVVDLAKMPHLLVAGTTGSGKSVGINAMILSLLYKHTPETCRLIMIDPKMLELSVYDGIPHLLTPVVTDPNKAIVALKWAVREMETRYMSMSKLGVRNIDSYNTRLIEARKKGEVLTKSIQVGFDPDTGQAIFEDQHIDLTPLPFIVVVIDEVADLMLVAGKEIESAVQRLAQMARAAGIHVVMATQRPSVDVITGTIKANFPTRISFQVTSKIDSRTILGEQGGEQLLGRGDMLYMAGGGKLTRVHGPFVEDGEVEKVTKFLSDQSIPDYDETITEEPESSYSESVYGLANKNNNQNDELYDQAVALIARERKASTSFIQRYFKIGYNRAATIIEKMEENNVISKPGRAGKREVLIEDN
ncbi:DNA translocase FtsK 4TM domain-containing protein [Alphaproteobacteria bacterium]|nr:DNA translocase FtsK 4TM domain-containing protein [Alphaproteobacteria bacterium]